MANILLGLVFVCFLLQRTLSQGKYIITNVWQVIEPDFNDMHFLQSLLMVLQL